jgi:hypothetical protein
VKRLDVVKKGENWVGQSGGRTVRGTGAIPKADAVKSTAGVARKSKEPISVKIHKEKGGIQEERTYPGSADLKRSEG